MIPKTVAIGALFLWITLWDGLLASGSVVKILFLLSAFYVIPGPFAGRECSEELSD